MRFGYTQVRARTSVLSVRQVQRACQDQEGRKEGEGMKGCGVTVKGRRDGWKKGEVSKQMEGKGVRMMGRKGR